MTSKAALLALLTLWGVGAAVPHQAWADELTSEQAADSDGDAGKVSPLTDKVWVKAGQTSDLPGVIKIFLSDGTLVQDSCWETHRLSAWQQTGAKSVSWNEDGADIKADIVTLTADELVLSLKLKGGAVEEHYVPAPVPSTCPDMPKS
ncbi:MAG: hypothetical protein ACTHNL_07880 [Devosia sp.]|jgi:hypothetical protein